MQAKICSCPTETRAISATSPPRGKFPNPVRPRLYASVKRLFDVVLSLVMVVPAVPLILIAAAAVRLTSRGPAFYSQVRLGRNGQPFRMYKIRSMVVDSE